MLAHFANEPARWWCLFGKAVPIRFSEWFGLLGLIALASYLLPAKVGIPARIFVLNRRYQLPISTISAILTWDIVISLLVWGAFGIAAAAWLVRHGVVFDNRAVKHPVLVTVAALLLLALAAWGFGKLKSLKWWKSRPEIASGRLAGVVCLSAADAIAEGLRHVALAQAMDLPLDMSTAFFGGIAAFAAGMLSLMPMGLGGYDLTLILVFSSAGVSWESTAQLCMVNRAALVFYSLAIGLWSGKVFGLNPRTLANQIAIDIRQQLKRRRKSAKG